MAGWFNRYTHGVTPDASPAECTRGPDQFRASRKTHVAARPAYSSPRRRHASRHVENTKTRANSMTTTGAVTIDSLQAMPSAHVAMAASCHVGFEMARRLA